MNYSTGGETAGKGSQPTERLAPQVGLEPTTLRLTAECSAIELLRNDCGCTAFGVTLSRNGFYNKRPRAWSRRGSLETIASEFAILAPYCGSLSGKSHRQVGNPNELITKKTACIGNRKAGPMSCPQSRASGRCSWRIYAS